jgi:hypothetical protein
MLILRNMMISPGSGMCVLLHTVLLVAKCVAIVHPSPLVQITLSTLAWRTANRWFSIALAGRPVIFAQGEQRRLLLGGHRLGTAKRHQIAPQIAAAVDLDEAGQGHGGQPGRL